MKKIFVIFLFCSLKGSSQQLHFTSQYMENNYLYNPAAAGLSQHSSVGLAYRSMWSGIDGGPKTQMLYGDFALSKLNAGIATYIYNDVTGPTRRTGINLAYSYHIVSTGGNVFAIGMEIRTLQFYYDMVKLSQYIPNDPLLAGSNSKIVVDGGAGIYYRADKFRGGISVSQLIQSKLKFADIANAGERSKLVRHFTLLGSYDFNTGDNSKLTPNIRAAYIPHSPMEFEFGAVYNYQEKLYWGISWRLNQSWVLQGGYTFNKKLSIAYARDIYTTPLNAFTDGGAADEIMLKYNFGK